jgi:hypothetical protein
VVEQRNGADWRRCHCLRTCVSFLFLIFIYWKNPTVVTFLHTQFFGKKIQSRKSTPMEARDERGSCKAGKRAACGDPVSGGGSASPSTQQLPSELSGKRIRGADEPSGTSGFCLSPVDSLDSVDPGAFECPCGPCEYDCQKRIPVRSTCACKRLLCRKCASVAASCASCGADTAGAADFVVDAGVLLALMGRHEAKERCVQCECSHDCLPCNSFFLSFKPSHVPCACAAQTLVRGLHAVWVY